MKQTMLERELFRTYWADGVLDLLSGGALLVAGLGWEGPLGPLAVLQAPLWVLFWEPLHRRVIEPRAGYVRFSLARRERTDAGLRWTLVAGVGVLALLLAGAFLWRRREAEPLLEQLAPALPALLLVPAAAVTSLLTGARRFLFYGSALVVAAASTVLLDGGPAPPLVAVGLLMVASGATLLARFVRGARAYAEGA